MLHTWMALPEGWNRNFESSVTASCRACSSTGLNSQSSTHQTLEQPTPAEANPPLAPQCAP